MSQYQYTLRYFNIQGLAETIRLLLTAAQVDWKEEHPEWPLEKPKQPLGHLPVLVETSTGSDKEQLVLSETLVIERYIARKYGLVPGDILAAALHEQLRDQLHDVWSTHMEYMHSTGERSAELVVKFEQDARRLAKVHVAALQRNGNIGHVFGNTLSYVDLSMYAFYKFFFNAGPRSLKEKTEILDYTRIPEVSKLMSVVEAAEELTAYFTREKTNGSCPATRFT
ncbi:hypothetical protein GGI04_001271 [Coemansia thaxteri]|nr:hypothetical protein GGI04_001271 [Coemansia thaxteri]